MQQIQISRGKLEVRRKTSSLLNGELFIDYSNGAKYDGDDQSYELYAGVDGQAIKLGGQGVLSFIRATSAKLDGTGLPSSPVAGGIYYVSSDIELKDTKDPSGKNNPEFRAGDLAIYVGEDLHKDAILNTFVNRFSGAYEAAPGWIRINNGGGDAYEVTFDPSNTNFQSTTTNVQEALVELDRNKLSFGGIKLGKNVTGTETDLTTSKKSNVNTGTDGDFTITAASLFPYVNAGYYYSVGELADNSHITIVLSGDGSSSSDSETITLEEGDFLAVTSKTTTNDRALTVSDVTFTKIAGGTHDAARINYKMGDRASTYTNSSDADWDDEDKAVKNVKEALDLLTKSKADLSDDGKILLTQLPDTLINSMEFQGSYIIETPSDGTTAVFTLPTAANKVVHSDETQEAKDEELVQGDYWIYSGPQFNISTNTSITSSEGYLNSGDWLVYNGDGKWSIIDNSSPIQSISLVDDYHEGGATTDHLTQETINGDVLFEGHNRGGDRNNTVISETQLSTDHKSQIVIHADNAALISDENKADINGFYKENLNKTLVKTGVSESDDNQLIFNEALGVQMKGAVSVTADSITGLDGVSYKKGDVLTTNVKQNPNQANYGNITDYLPAKSGTIARLEDVGLADGQGTNFYIPRYKLEDDGTKSLVNSPIELIDNDAENGVSNKLVGIKFHGSSTNTFKFNSSVVFRTDATEDSIQIMPKYSGFILNSNSIIDCGEWTDTGVVFANEGKQNTHYSTSFDVKSSSYFDGIKSGTIPSA